MTSKPPRVLEHPGGAAHRERIGAVDETRIPVAGDPFYAAARRTATDQGEPHGCYGGYHYIGHMACDPETGEEVEVCEPVPCSRCSR